MHTLTTDRKKWGAITLVAGMLLLGSALFAVRPWTYWAAKHRGEGADLRRAMLVFGPLERANLFGANLAGADPRDANLLQASLEGTNLAGADLHGANLAEAYLDGADLAGSDLGQAKLARAILADSNLQGVSLLHSDLRGSNLEGADLRGVNLTMVLGLDGAYLEGARYDELMDWPDGLDPAKHGAILDN